MPRFIFFLAALFLTFSFATANLAAEMLKNPAYNAAVKKYYESVDKSKAAYQKSLETDLASAQRRGEVALYLEIEKELEHTKTDDGHILSDYSPKTQTLYRAKSLLKRNVEAARSQFQKAVKEAAKESLKNGNIEEAKTFESAANTKEPGRIPVATAVIPAVVRQGGISIDNRAEGEQQKAIVNQLPSAFRLAPSHLAKVQMAYLTIPEAELLTELSSQKGSYTGFGQFTPDSKKFVSVSHGENGANVFDIATKKVTAKVRYPNSRLEDTDIHPSGEYAASGTQNGKIIFWSLSDGKIFRTIDAHENGKYVRGVRFNSDGSMIAARGEGNAAAIWDTKSGKELKRLFGHSEGVESVDFSPDNKILATYGGEGKVILWDVASGRQLHVISAQQGLRGVVFNNAGTVVAAAQTNDTVGLWDVRTGKPLPPLIGCYAEPITLGFSPDDSLLIIGGKDRRCRAAWDVSTRLPVYLIPSNDDEWLATLKYSPDGKMFAAPTHDPVQIFKAPTLADIAKWKAETERKRNFAKEIPLRLMPLEFAEACHPAAFCGRYKSSRKEFEDSIFAHAPSRLVFRLEKKWKTFDTSYGFCARGFRGPSNCIFIVKADGKEVFRSGEIKDAIDRPLSLDVRNVDRLELIVDPNGGTFHDHSVWFSPKLTR